MATTSTSGNTNSAQRHSIDAAQFDQLNRHRFSLCGVQVVLEHAEPGVCDQLHQRWRELFAVSSERPTAATSSVRLHWSSRFDAEKPKGQMLCETNGLRVIRLAEGFQLDCGSANLRIDLAESVGWGALSESFFRTPLDAQRRFLLLALIMLIRRHGRFALHASGVTKANRGCLIVGRSGAGKTTLALSLIRCGWSNLSDDVVALRCGDAAIDALAVNRGFSCTRQTAQAFEKLVQGHDQDGDKQILQLANASSKSATECQPKLILLPTIGNDSDSRLIPVSPLDAVNELIQFSAGIMINQDEASQQLDTINRLVSQSRVYRLIAGRDVLDNPRRVEQMISHAAGEQ